MQLEHSFTLPVGLDEAWALLLDIDRIAPCIPGATIDSVTGDDFTGSVKVKLGPINLTYQGRATFVEKDESAHRTVLEAAGLDMRGNGNATAKMIVNFAESDGSTTVHVQTDLDITGKPAQFGRGVMLDVGNKLLGQFAGCLATQLGVADSEAPAPAASPGRGAARSTASAGAPTTAASGSRAASTPVPGPASDTDSIVTAAPATVAPTERPPEVTPSPAPVADVSAATARSAEAPPEATRSASNGSRDGRPQPLDDVEPGGLDDAAGPAVAKRLAAVLAPLVVALIITITVLRRRNPSRDQLFRRQRLEQRTRPQA